MRRTRVLCFLETAGRAIDIVVYQSHQYMHGRVPCLGLFDFGYLLLCF